MTLSASLEAAPRWAFRRMDRAELNSNPVEGEFFTPQGIADALVRESIQNSLDARLDGRGEPARVRIRFSGSRDALPGARASRYLAGLHPHLEVQGELSFRPDPSQPMPFLTVEDFGTRGLTGDPFQEDDRHGSGESKNHFYYFWRNIGRSAKEQKDLGRWGLGKTVFPATSQINSFFGLTNRFDDGRLLLMGQSVLTVHQLDGQRCYPYGYFARHEGDDFALPVEDEAFVAGFCHDFGLQRDHSPGLSVVVPYPDADLSETDLLRSVIAQYFYPILARELVVEVQYADDRFHLDGTTLEDVTERLGAQGRFRPDAMRRLYDMARWALALEDSDRIMLQPAGIGTPPAWSEVLFDDGLLEDLERRFARGDRLAIRAPVQVQRRGHEPEVSHLDAYLQRDPELPRAEEHYVRQGITIPGIRMVRDRTVRGLLVVEEKALASLLGDSENPAHTDWQERRALVKQRFDRARDTIRFARASLRELVKLLARPPEGRDENLLSDVFFLDIEPAAQEMRSPSGRNRRRGGSELPNPRLIPGVQRFRLERYAGGFELKGHPEHASAGERFVVRVAYNVRRGNAFKSWDSRDFRLEKPPLRIEPEGAAVEKVSGNRMELRAERPDFRLAVTGFDMHRDLVVSARRLDSSS